MESMRLTNVLQGCLVDELGIETINVMKQVKQALDPKYGP